MRYLIAGKEGQLAKAFLRRLEGADLVAPDEKDFDITQAADIEVVFQTYRPDVVINCAAYNFVDKAEEEHERAFRVNSMGPSLLARACEKAGALLVHFSSDYVFDGEKENGLYVESDSPNPINEYGRSKLSGEKAIIDGTDRFLLCRLSWVFGDGEQNFIHKLLTWAKSKDHLKIVCDEFSVPTYTETVVDVVLKAIDRGLSGIFHLTNSGFCSRYEWARHVFSTLGMNKFLRPVSLEDFDLPAQRPKFSAMSNERIASLLDMEIPSWEESVRYFLSKREYE